MLGTATNDHLEQQGQGARAMKLRELIDQHGNVITPPGFHIGGQKCDVITAAIWREYRESQVAAPFDESDPYTTEVGGG